jgi:plastocyanin domain-containing protein
MLNKTQIFGRLIGLGLLLLMTSGVPATASTSAEMSTQTGQFHRIEQPLVLKLGVTLGGVALIGLELWWFVLSKNKPSQTTANQDTNLSHFSH